MSKRVRPILDEATFQKILAAAYVVQEHHDHLRPAAREESEPAIADSDSSRALAEIVETQHQIQRGHLDLNAAMNLVTERIAKITGAQGAAIALLDQEKVVYRAATGILASQVGSTMRPEAALSASALLHEVILRCPDAGTDFRLNPEIAKRLRIGSLIAIPLFHDGKTSGALELVFAKPGALQERDVRTCQLMAGLVTEALTHAAEEEWRKGVTAERASMLEVLEKIKPQLARLATEPGWAAAPVHPEPSAAATAPEETHCQQCGRELAPGEMFCGACGASRSTVSRHDLENKWTTLWNLKQAGEPPAAASRIESGPNDSQPAETELTGHVWPDFILPEKPAEPAPKPDPQPMMAMEPKPDSVPTAARSQSQSIVPLMDTPADPLAPATTAHTPAPPREMLHSITVSPPAVQLKGFWQKNKDFLKKHPGDLALVIALLLFLITIIWAVSSNNPTTSADSGKGPATAPAGPAVKPKRKPPEPPQLSLFEQMLVSLGLAEAPPPPSYTGNPNVPVWVDVHTALYYCPGSELYGKTPQGRIASQRDAQMDQFEPASRKVCD
jgi:hypothetical protein